MSENLDTVPVDGNMTPSTEDVPKVEDVVTEPETQVEPPVDTSIDAQLDELFKTLAEELDAPKRQSEPEAKKEEDPFYSENSDAIKQELEELKAKSAEFETTLKAKEDTHKAELDELSKKLLENERTVSDSAEIWKELMNHPILGKLVEKFVNDEPIDLASDLLKNMEEEAKALETTTASSSEPNVSGKPSIMSRVRSVKY